VEKDLSLKNSKNKDDIDKNKEFESLNSKIVDTKTQSSIITDDKNEERKYFTSDPNSLTNKSNK